MTTSSHSKVTTAPLAVTACITRLVAVVAERRTGRYPPLALGT